MNYSDLPPEFKELLAQELAAHKLPDAFCSSYERGILPTAHYIFNRSSADETPIWGICGAQGTGKSTMVHFLSLTLEHLYKKRSVCLSLDDFYLSHEARKNLAEDVHPLFATRGVPGTHNVDLGVSTIRSLQSLGNSDDIVLPRFDKASDDCAPRSEWPTLSGSVDLILFEGWCVGTPPQPDEALSEPCNSLEAEEDSNKIWRTYVNEQLKNSYRRWFAMLDHRIFLRAPSFEQVIEWRSLQEEKLRQYYIERNSIKQNSSKRNGIDPNSIDRNVIDRNTTEKGVAAPDKIMSSAELRRFISHYERLTRWNIECLPQCSDVVLELKDDHSISEPIFQKSVDG